jgi:predicted component of type VI protein secretion system
MRGADQRSAASAPRPAKVQAGKLLGWLLSYENPDGRAIELREGRFFITSNSIKENDLVIEDPSISTPHALMSVAVHGGVKVQDLMSEGGTYIRPADEQEYGREEASVELQHGDWIRLGEVEFLVALVPISGVRE